MDKAINFSKFKSMKRIHAILRHILRADMAAESKLDRLYTRALVVQCFKAFHGFAQQGDWPTSWPLKHIPDPIENNQLGGTELEMECVLAVLKTKADLLEKSTASRSRAVREPVSDGEDEKEKAPGKIGKNGKRTRRSAPPPAPL